MLLEEKATPQCKLAVGKAMVGAGQVRATRGAREGAGGLGVGLRRHARRRDGPTTAGCHKSVTPHADHRLWQDVYRPLTPAGEVYLKLTMIDDVLIVPFQELWS